MAEDYVSLGEEEPWKGLEIGVKGKWIRVCLSLGYVVSEVCYVLQLKVWDGNG